MCGITGYIGYREADKILFDCLKKLEYRGYDSCGIALVNDDRISITKDLCRVNELESKHIFSDACIGIGHTRWATCGEPTVFNAHPHSDCSEKVAIVHNGTIDNYLEIKEELINKGHKFVSETDTEVVPHLIEENLKSMNAEKAVVSALNSLKGSYAIAVAIAGDEHLYLGRVNCPLVIGIMDGENIIASDSTALSKYTNRFVYLKDNDIAIVSKDDVLIIRDGEKIEPTIEISERDIHETDLLGYPHYMLKEIHEQPRVISKTLDDIDNIKKLITKIEKELNGIKHVRILACGSSYYASLMLRYLAPEFLGIQVFSELGSEYCALNKAYPGSLAIAISQSGETADTIKAAKAAKAAGYKLLTITNVDHSQLTRIADYTYITNAGAEVSVAATKTVMSQLVMTYALTFAHPKIAKLTQTEWKEKSRNLPELVNAILDNTDSIISASKYLKDINNAIFVARGRNYPIALEGALKMKEIAYIHSEGYAAGELKHGPFALLNENIPVIAIVTHDEYYDSLITNLREIKTRKSPIIAITESSDIAIENVSDQVIVIPECDTLFAPILNLVAVQLLAYFTAVEKGNPVDFPRNLAKTVTVE